MIELHVVGVAEDGTLLLDVEPGGEGRYRVHVDGRRWQRVGAHGPGQRPPAVVGAPDGGAPAAAPPPEPRLTPAQIQQQLRRGLSADVVARLAGVEVAAVLRWARPIEAEQHRVLQVVLDGPVEDGRRRTTRTLAALVGRWLPDGTPAGEVRWRVARRADGAWRVALQAPGRDRVLTATWVHDDGRTCPASERARTICFPDR